jgi:hypothetical protein
MDNFDICQKIYDSMEHPDYYDEKPDDNENWTDEEEELARERWR